jgi:hypothetical protein
MSLTFASFLALQVALPLALLTWQAHGHDDHIVPWLLKHTAAATYIYATSIAGLWLVAPWYVPHVIMVVSLSLAARTLPGALWLWQSPQSSRQWFGIAMRAAIAVASASTLAMALQGRKPPAGTIVDLDFPLKSGHYYIANGGSADLVNAHVRMLSSDRFRRYRGSSYGIDIVALRPLGNRATGPASHELERFAIFGHTIYAPCAGVVIRAEDGLPDLTPPNVDRQHMAGNFVMIECGDGEFHVLLGHMQDGSLRVHPGDYVTVDTPLGAVGNSGNSDEPHLHVHAQRPGRIWDLFAGDPLPMRFNGRVLVRNDRVTRRDGRPEIIDD